MSKGNFFNDLLVLFINNLDPSNGVIYKLLKYSLKYYHAIFSFQSVIDDFWMTWNNHAILNKIKQYVELLCKLQIKKLWTRKKFKYSKATKLISVYVCN